MKKDEAFIGSTIKDILSGQSLLDDQQVDRQQKHIKTTKENFQKGFKLLGKYHIVNLNDYAKYTFYFKPMTGREQWSPEDIEKMKTWGWKLIDGPKGRRWQMDVFFDERKLVK